MRFIFCALLISSCNCQFFGIDFEEDSGFFDSYFYPSLIGGLELRKSRDLNEENKHECDRICDENETPKECKFDFTVELFNTLSKACFDCPTNRSDCFRPDCVVGDGVEKGIITINRQMPGPPVVVCQGDKVVVDVHNHLHTETFSIHWHGEHMRNGYQYMDGTPHITQCPILPAANFRYTFIAETAGSHFYHSHTSFQRADGAFGPFVVRQPQDPHQQLYDFDLTEHVIFPQEWFHISSREAFVLHHWDTGKNKADNMLINGFGRRSEDQRAGTEPTPTAQFNVEPGKRYRFRVAQPGFTLCPIQVSVDQHDLVMIASDGNPIEPMQVKSFIVHPGERYDFVINADQMQPENGYFLMRFAGLFDCAKLKAHAVARLAYSSTGEDVNDLTEDSVYEDCLDSVGPVLNPLNYAPLHASEDFAPNWIPITKARALNPVQDPLKETADKVFYLGYDLNARDNPHFHDSELYSYEDVEGGNKLRTPQINNRTLAMPTSPLLTQYSEDNLCLYQEEADKTCGEEEFCECLFVLKVALNDVVELVLIDEGIPYDVSHPFHIHGHAFHVVAMERHAANSTNIGAGSGGVGNRINREEVIALDKAGFIKRNLDNNPPLKDTVSVPDAGFTIVRFLADNPGFWLFHCHMSWHNHLGMGVVIQVGDPTDVEKPIPTGFPTCADFV